MAGKEIWGWVKSLALAVILAVVIREHVLAFYVVDGNSMLPTLNNGQMVAVNKLVYNFNSPRHGDVVVFLTEFGGENRVFIKRVIALPGDILEIQDGQVLVNGTLLQEDYLDVQMNGDYGPHQIELDSLFVMGDNRRPTGSWDSREFGPILLEKVIGRAEVVVFPIPTRVD